MTFHCPAQVRKEMASMTNKDFEDYLESIGAEWAHLGGADYAVTLKTGSV
jgi:hypothetical protein